MGALLAVDEPRGRIANSAEFSVPVDRESQVDVPIALAAMTMTMPCSFAVGGHRARHALCKPTTENVKMPKRAVPLDTTIFSRREAYKWVPN